MDEGELNPLLIILMYILRCGIPLAVMLGVSYLLRRLGLIKDARPAPKDWDDNHNNNESADGGLAHGKA